MEITPENESETVTTETTTEITPQATENPTATNGEDFTALRQSVDTLPDRIATAVVAALGAMESTAPVVEVTEEAKPVAESTEPPVETHKDESPEETHWYFKPLFGRR